MKHGLTRFLHAVSLLLGLCILLSGCISLGNDENGTSKIEYPTLDPNATEEVYPPYRIAIEEVLDDLKTQLDPRYLTVVNKNHPLTEENDPEKKTYSLEPMTEIPQGWAKTSGMMLESRTNRVLCAMLEEMAADGITDVKVVSAYRSKDRQTTLFSQYLLKEQSNISADAYAYFGFDYIKSNYIDHGKNALSMEDAELVANFYSAKPGESEHHTGLCVDFSTQSESYLLNTSFEDTPAGQWLIANSYRFGFILRYPEDKESITGYCYEPWHFRFVGREAAAEITKNNLTLEEYLHTN